MLYVKICGITRLEDAQLAAALGADAIGFVFYEKSPRNISPLTAAQISQQLPPHIARVGVFVNPGQFEISKVMSFIHLDAIQLHGLPPGKRIEGYNGLPVIPAIQVKDRIVSHLMESFRQEGAALLLDSFHADLHGGSGKTFDWKYAVEAARTGRVILAGGLNPGNVAQAVQFVKPYGVDVSSGVESSPGLKDGAKLIAFFKNLRKYRYDWKADRTQLFPLA